MKHPLDEKTLYQEIPKIVEKELSQLPAEEEVHHVFSDAFEQRMADLMDATGKRKEPKHFSLSRRGAAVAAVFSLFILGVMTRVFAVETSREAVFQFFRRTYEEFTSIRVHEDTRLVNSEEKEQLWKALEPLSPPQGFTEVSREQEEQYLELTFQDSAGHEILFFTYPLGGEEILIDTEGVSLHQKVIEGTEVLYLEKSGTSTILWHDQVSQYHISGDVAMDILMPMAEGMLRQ